MLPVLECRKTAEHETSGVVLQKAPKGQKLISFFSRVLKTETQ